MAQEEAREIYQLHILLLKISPAIWRCVLVPSDQSLADLHHVLQIVMGWDDSHLPRTSPHSEDDPGSQTTGSANQRCIPSRWFPTRLVDGILQSDSGVDAPQHRIFQEHPGRLAITVL